MVQNAFSQSNFRVYLSSPELIGGFWFLLADRYPGMKGTCMEKVKLY